MEVQKTVLVNDSKKYIEAQKTVVPTKNPVEQKVASTKAAPKTEPKKEETF